MMFKIIGFVTIRYKSWLNFSNVCLSFLSLQLEVFFEKKIRLSHYAKALSMKLILNIFYRTPCISFFNRGVRIADKIPNPIGINVKIQKK